jgi:tryptophan halogenase
MNITIIGGGTAGWLAAYTLSKSQPSIHNITVIESTEIGIIGAGEGSTGFFTDLIAGRYFKTDIEINDFVSQTDATNKIGIKFNNWLGNNHSFFTPLDGSPTAGLMNDYVFKYVLHKFGKNKIHLASKIGIDYETERNFNVFNAFHFNAHKVGKFFKEKCLKENVKHIDSIVNDCIIDTENGNVTSLILKNGQVIDSEFFIDCSGFSRILMKKLNVGWKSYSKYLPCNSAMPFLLDYRPNDNIQPWTNATALSSGWMWDIPLQSRRGCGYVYNDNFINSDQAKMEVEKLLGREISPIKIINFDPGRSEKFWEKNVLSLGLASCFVEPLQATSIHTTVAQILLFVNDFLNKDLSKTNTPENQESYNRRTAHFYDLNLDFVSMHYQGGRIDTPFWKYVKNDSIISPFAENIIKRSKNKLVSYFEIANNFGAPAIGLWNWSMAGLDLLNQDSAYTDLLEYNMYETAEHQFLKHITTNYN